MWKHWFLPKCPHLETGSKWGLWRVSLTSAALQRAVDLVHVQCRCDFCLTVPVHFHPWCYELELKDLGWILDHPMDLWPARYLFCATHRTTVEDGFLFKSFFLCMSVCNFLKPCFFFYFSFLLSFFNLEVVPVITLWVMEKWYLFAWDSLMTVSGL